MSDRRRHSVPAPSEEDERLLVELRAIVERVDPVPRAVIDAALAGFTWRTVDAEPARSPSTPRPTGRPWRWSGAAPSRGLLTIEAPACRPRSRSRW
jgi:hypothetical protein